MNIKKKNIAVKKARAIRSRKILLAKCLSYARRVARRKKKKKRNRKKRRRKRRGQRGGARRGGTKLPGKLDDKERLEETLLSRWNVFANSARTQCSAQAGHE